jgi:biotin carboxyl carrier protein
MLTRYNFAAGERQYKVALERQTGSREFHLQVGDRTSHVLLLKTENQGKRLSLLIDSKPHLASILKESEAAIQLVIDGMVVELVRQERLPTFAQALPPLPRITGKRPERGAVAAHMPGKVVLVNVREGDKVEKGQTLLVLESMKMEASLGAPKSGVVKEIRVKEGNSISQGEILMVIE